MVGHWPVSDQLNTLTKSNFVGEIYCTFSMRKSLTMCNNVTICNNG